MATFEDVVKQLQMNNRSEAGRDSRHTKMLSDLKNSIEGLTIATEQSSEPEASRTLPEASKEEKDKEERSRASKLLDAVGGLKDSLKTGLSDLGKVGTGVPGLTLGLLAKLALVPLLIKFLQSPVWDNIKAFLLDPSFGKLGELFKEYPVTLSTLSVIVGGFAISKIIDAARLVRKGFIATQTNLKKLTGDGKDSVKGGFGKKLLKFTKGAGIFGLVVSGALAAFEGVNAAIEESKREGATKLDIFKAGLGGAIESLTFGLISAEKVKEGFDSIVEKSNSAFQTIKSRLTPSEGFKKRLSELNPFKDVSFEGLRTSLAEIDIFGGLREKLANFKLPELKLPEMPDISKLVEDQMNEIFSFFKNLLSVDVNSIIDAIPGATDTLKALGILERTTNERIEILEADIAEQQKMLAMGDKRTALGFSREKILAEAQQELQGLKELKLLEEQGMPAFQTGGLLSAGKFALVGEQGPELVMSRSPMQVFSEQRTDQLGMAALNRLTGGGDAGGGGSMFINQGNNVQNVSRSISPTFIVNQDTVLTTISKSLAM